MSWESVNALKQQVPLHQYLNSQQWQPVRHLSGGRLLGLCPLHRDHNPSFLVDPAKSLFYCYGCGRGGDVIRFVELYYGVTFSQAMAHIRNSFPSVSLLTDVARFYTTRLHRHPEAVDYLRQRGICAAHVLDHLEIGYAPGRCLRQWLTTLGYALSDLQRSGLISATGHDTFSHRIVFPLDSNLYGRSIGQAPPHRFLPGPKGGLYRWDKVRHCADVILVEGLFDLATLWQAGFRNVTCSPGSHLNAQQLDQLCDDVTRNVYLAFDCDANGSGQAAAREIVHCLSQEGILAKVVLLPEGHDPNSFFVNGGDASHFRRLLEQARP